MFDVAPLDGTEDVSAGHISLALDNTSGGMAVAALLKADLISPTAELACDSTELIRPSSSGGTSSTSDKCIERGLSWALDNMNSKGVTLSVDFIMSECVCLNTTCKFLLAKWRIVAIRKDGPSEREVLLI